MNIGVTFSQIQCNYLNIPYIETLESILALPINFIRVCAYWNEIEKEKNKYDWQILDEIIAKSINANKNIILALGVKAPRWPEFHIPSWITLPEDSKVDQSLELREQSIKFCQNLLERYKDFDAIKYVQIENEPFNKLDFINNRHLSNEFVDNELHIAKMIVPNKKFLLSCAINLKPFEKGKEYNDLFKITAEKADAIGVNIYTKVGIPGNRYIADSFLYWWKLKNWFNYISSKGKEAWVTELQSEPWEHASAVHTSQEIYPSASPNETERAFYKLKRIGFSNILLWGAEYWYWHKKHKRDIWWTNISSLIQRNIQT